MHITEYKDVAYGPYDRNKLDAYIIDSGSHPSPVLIFFHGGGYLNGDKKDLRADWKQECLEAGISVVTCNYRFISSDPFPAPMNDGTRAIQFVRSMSSKWNIDPLRIASSGSSAGGHIALWNALKGDLAKPDSEDEVERQSSAVAAFIGYATQVSKDQRFYEGIYRGPHIQPNLALYYGIPSIDELYLPETLKLAEEASAITYMSQAAPPAFMIYYLNFDFPWIPEEAPVGDVIHHPMHGYILKQKYDELRIPYVFRHTGDPVRPGEIARFLQDCFARDKS